MLATCHRTKPSMDGEMEGQAAYMKKFQMEAILEALVNETLEQQPEDPIAFMSEQMQFMASALAGAVGSEPEAEPVQHAWT